MLHVVFYDKATNLLLGTRRSSSLTDASVLETETRGALVVPGGHPVFQHGETRYRLYAGRIEPKIVLTFSATPNPFDADGVAECLITLDPPEELTVLVGTEPVILSPADPEIILTADTPQHFTISLALHPVYWADPLIVEAT